MLHPTYAGSRSWMVPGANDIIFSYQSSSPRALPVHHVTRGIDLETGRPIEVEETEPRANEVMREICPAAPGAKDWRPSAFSPRTGFIYVPHQHLCMDMKPVETS